MASDELLERIDRHIERGVAALELNHAAFDRNTEAFERNRETLERVIAVLDRHEQLLDDQHEFMREMTVRNERVTQALVAEVRGIGEGQHELRMELRTELRDLHDESRTQREALLRVVDKLK